MTDYSETLLEMQKTMREIELYAVAKLNAEVMK